MFLQFSSNATKHLLPFNRHVLVQRMSSSSNSLKGPVQDFIEKQIGRELAPLELQVKNESHRRPEDESHFHVLVVSEKFKGMPLIERHRLVQSLLTDEKGELKFHALRISAKTPEQWDKNVTLPQAPSCTGKGDGRGPTDTTRL